MTLHETTEFSKKFGIGSAIGLGIILVLVIFFKIGVFVKDILFPPKIAPANVLYGKIPQIDFPQSTVKGDFTYSIDTLDGNLPSDFPDRLIIYKMVPQPPNLLNLDAVKKKVQALGFVDTSGNTLPEIPRGGSNYEWDEQTGIQRKILYNTVTLNFSLTSNYLTSLDVLAGQTIKDQTTAFATVQGFLGDIESLPSDVNLDLTTAPDPANDYTTKPVLYDIDASTGQLVKTTSLQHTKVIRVDLYQKGIEYSLTAGKDNELTHFQNFDMKLPILYPHPPFSTMHFMVASAADQAQVVAGDFNHQSIDLSTNNQPDQLATYPIKTAQQAFDELKKGTGYVAAYNGTDSQILINKVYLAYYIGDSVQKYLMPIIVFEGQNGFFAYVPAVLDTALE